MLHLNCLIYCDSPVASCYNYSCNFLSPFLVYHTPATLKSYKCVTILMYIHDILNDVMILGLSLVHVYMMNTDMVCSCPLSVLNFLLREVSSVDYSVLIITGYFYKIK